MKLPDFTASQRSAIEFRSLDACVIAGPGSGKTTVLVERFRALVEERQFDPRHILAITFTEKAAANMKVKLAEKFAHDDVRLRDLESAWVSTIHGFCMRLLRENAIAAGIDPRFAVLDAREAEQLRYVCLNDALDELVAHRRADALDLIPIAPDLLHTLPDVYDAIRCAGKTIAEVRAIESLSRQVSSVEMAENLRRLIADWPTNTASRRTKQRELEGWADRLENAGSLTFEGLIQLQSDYPIRTLNSVPESAKEAMRALKADLQSLVALAVDRHTARFRELIFHVLARFDEIYNDRKLARGVLDFNDLERRAIQLLRGNPAVCNRIRAQFRQVMLDEFQDINQQQSDLIELVRGDDVFFAVGDANQSIYGFRHARPEIFDEYQASIAAGNKHSVSMLDNFRSRATILRCVESLLNTAVGIKPHNLVAGAAFADQNAPSIEILKIQPNEDEAGAEKEARWIAFRILDLRGKLQLSAGGRTRLADFSDFAVLCRNGDSMKPILAVFDDRGIPYVSSRRESFLMSREGRDLTALLHIIANPRDAIALATVMRSPLVALSDEALLRIRLLAHSLPAGLNRLDHERGLLADFDPKDADKAVQFASNLKRWREAQPVTLLEPLLVRALTDCGFSWTPGTIAAANIESFCRLARNKASERSLAEFLKEIESLRDAVNPESDLADKDQGNTVQVMTAHAAKGLEFPVTIIAAMDKGSQRGPGPVSFTPGFGLGVKWRSPFADDDTKYVDDSWQLRNSEDLKKREDEEENRLLYVAMTRAEERLILSYSRKKVAQNWAKMVDTLGPCDDISVIETADEPPLLHVDDIESFATDVPAVDLPEVTAQHDTAVNVTSLAVFAECPRKYYLQRYLGWNGARISRFDPEEDLPEADEPDLTSAELGSAVHEILAEKSGTHPEEAQRLANVFRESSLGARAAASKRIEREWDFIVDVEGALVRGTIDLWFEENGEITVVDYKTDMRVNPAAYTPQLALYALALERAFGKRPAHAYLHFLRSNTVVEVSLDYPVTDLLAELRAAQDTLRFDLREGDHCHTCQFRRSLCPAGFSAAAEPPAAQTPSQSAAAS